MGNIWCLINERWVCPGSEGFKSVRGDRISPHDNRGYLYLPIMPCHSVTHHALSFMHASDVQYFIKAVYLKL